jgi:hypothetical protein
MAGFGRDTGGGGCMDVDDGSDAARGGGGGVDIASFFLLSRRVTLGIAELVDSASTVNSGGPFFVGFFVSIIN